MDSSSLLPQTDVSVHVDESMKSNVWLNFIRSENRMLKSVSYKLSLQIFFDCQFSKIFTPNHCQCPQCFFDYILNQPIWWSTFSKNCVGNVKSRKMVTMIFYAFDTYNNQVSMLTWITSLFIVISWNHACFLRDWLRVPTF